MQHSKEQLFETLESILSILSEIYVMTENQETIILHSTDQEILSQLIQNKQNKIIKLNQLEGRFEAFYEQAKEGIKDKAAIKKLQDLVANIMKTKEKIAKAEEKNRRLWEQKDKPKVQAKPILQSPSYMVDQYKKHKKP